jgi:hypothetical protein
MGPAEVKTQSSPLRIINNGHTCLSRLVTRAVWQCHEVLR